MRLRYIPIAILMSFSLGAGVAHLSLPEKARLTKEQAQHLVDKKYHVMGYLREGDNVFNK